MESTAAAERAARWDRLRALARVMAEIILWTALGLGGIGLAFHTLDIDLGWVYWWAGSVIWFAGVSFSVLSAYRRGEERGDW